MDSRLIPQDTRPPPTVPAVPNDLPVRYEAAVIDIFSYRFGERFFLANTWLSEHISKERPEPTPMAWLISAERLADAEQCSTIIRNILDGMAEDMRWGMEKDEMAAVLWMVHQRCYVCPIKDAVAILGDLSVPFYFNPDVHEGGIETINIIPFNTDTGFSADIVQKYQPLVPLLV
jgi:hypothetical protein